MHLHSCKGRSHSWLVPENVWPDVLGFQRVTAKPDAMSADHMSSDHMGTTKKPTTTKHAMEEHMAKPDTMSSDHMAPEALKQ